MSGVTTNTVMRNFLVISDCFPQPDQASGDLRFFTLLSLLARKHKLLFCALNADGSVQPRNDASARLEQVGISTRRPSFAQPSEKPYHRFRVPHIRPGLDRCAHATIGI